MYHVGSMYSMYNIHMSRPRYGLTPIMGGQQLRLCGTWAWPRHVDLWIWHKKSTQNHHRKTTGKWWFNGIYIGWGPQDSVQLVYKWLKKLWFMVDITN